MIFRQWGQRMKGIDCGNEAAAWFEKVINKKGVRLLRHIPGLDFRPSFTVKGDKYLKTNEFPVIYHYSCACLLINHNSIRDLNKRLPERESVSYVNFRPNIVVEGEPYAEDEWGMLRIGELQLKKLKECERCVVTTIKPESGVTASEPLKTLKKYRIAKTKDAKTAFGNQPLFGMTYGVKAEGLISLSDCLYVTQTSQRIV
ncbi:hypothetical protein B4U79_04347 [Dinothrombium tinctorium]|uniref:MOSC domain-containing protein n=1 Tax=Dinothrombium tinctorium TaxID=1965070 RepID=A0A3S3NZF4_9ACAR|nr:hypothetical protein B4U79_03116 [Dinothrombium tinctorium]RWS12135.1 hypothetical protein B4U79_01118 [Dinothrombium tinctorium]RWS12173.1 hypothetical protein B4U79_04347 [Dinothrombium tinctorium]